MACRSSLAMSIRHQPRTWRNLLQQAAQDRHPRLHRPHIRTSLRLRHHPTRRPRNLRRGDHRLPKSNPGHPTTMRRRSLGTRRAVNPPPPLQTRRSRQTHRVRSAFPTWRPFFPSFPKLCDRRRKHPRRSPNPSNSRRGDRRDGDRVRVSRQQQLRQPTILAGRVHAMTVAGGCLANGLAGAPTEGALFPNQNIGQGGIDLPQQRVTDAGQAAKHSQIEFSHSVIPAVVAG